MGFQTDGSCKKVIPLIWTSFPEGPERDFLCVCAVDEGACKLVQTTYEYLLQAIDTVKTGVQYREQGTIIQQHTQAMGFLLYTGTVGLGSTSSPIQPSHVPHYTKNKAVGMMKSGHVFTVEPMS